MKTSLAIFVPGIEVTLMVAGEVGTPALVRILERDLVEAPPTRARAVPRSTVSGGYTCYVLLVRTQTVVWSSPAEHISQYTCPEYADTAS